MNLSITVYVYAFLSCHVFDRSLYLQINTKGMCLLHLLMEHICSVFQLCPPKAFAVSEFRACVEYGTASVVSRSNEDTEVSVVVQGLWFHGSETPCLLFHWMVWRTVHTHTHTYTHYNQWSNDTTVIRTLKHFFSYRHPWIFNILCSSPLAFHWVQKPGHFWYIIPCNPNMS